VQRQARLVRLTRRPDGRWTTGKPPADLPSGEVTVLGYVGAGIFAELERIDEHWPSVRTTQNAVVVLEVRTIPDVPSSTMVEAFSRWAGHLRDRDSRLILAGVDPRLAETLDRSGIAAALGPGNVVPATDVLLEAVETAYAEGQAWLADRAEEARADNDDSTRER
jgi:SulP family sulfate permease